MVTLGERCTPVFGPPGTGKTHTLLNLIEGLLQGGLRPQELAFFTFTRNARAEALARMGERLGLGREQLPWLRTIHSAALQLVKDGQTVMGPKHWKEFAEQFGYQLSEEKETEDEPFTPPSRTEHDTLRACHAYLRNRCLDPVEAVGHAPMRVPSDLYRLYVQRFDAFKTANGLLDFTDFLELALRRRVRPPVSVVFIDEAQDLSQLQQALVTMWSEGCDVYTAGDDDQCQPAGTMVTTPTGDRPIEQIVSGDRVVAWDQNGQEMRNLGAEVRRVASSQYSGFVTRIVADESMTEATPDHRFVARWSTRDLSLHAVYIMYRADMGYRVGWCQLFNSEGVLHLGMRAGLEKADRTWILHVTRSRQEASILESITAAKWGVPTATFEPLGGSTIYTRTALAQIFAAIPRGNGENCLREHGLDPGLPFWPPPDREKNRIGRRTIFQVYAINMRPEIMSIPNRQGVWVPIARVDRRHYEGTVHSLEVEKYGTYVADGLVTHNCIFTFQGANPDWLIGLYRRYGDRAMLLSQSYRVPRKAHALAETIVGRNKNRVPKDYEPAERDGSVQIIEWADAMAALEAAAQAPDVWDESRQVWRPRKTYLLARNWGVLATWQNLLSSRGIVYAIARGSSGITEKRRQAVMAAKEILETGSVFSTDLAILLEYYPSSGGVGGVRLPRGVKKWAGELQGRVTPAQFATWKLLPWIEYLRQVGPTEILLTETKQIRDTLARALARYGGAIPAMGKDSGLHLSTIHSTKGNEADTVILLSDMAAASYREFSSGGQVGFEAENRVAYVGVTRTRDELILVKPENYQSAYPYYQLAKSAGVAI